MTTDQSISLPHVGLVPDAATTIAPVASRWSYQQAFSRNLGLISSDEQQRLSAARIAIAGLGGVGGVHLATLARLGVGRFTIADPDHFDTANFNRQYGAKTRTLGRSKADVMAEEVRAINPEVRLTVMCDAVTPDNLGEFFEGADLFVDGVDFFSIAARRMLFAEARRRGIWALTAGPVGFSTAWLSFDPQGMSFDKYFDLHDQQTAAEQLLSFAVGLAPRATHLRYLDLASLDAAKRQAPSAGLACQLASGVAAAEALKILLGRGPLRPAPCYFQFDAYRQTLRKGRLWRGNRHPLQRLKRYVLRRRLADQIAAFENPTGASRKGNR